MKRGRPRKRESREIPPPSGMNKQDLRFMFRNMLVELDAMQVTLMDFRKHIKEAKEIYGIQDV